MDLKEIQNRNYKATVKRGLITNQTPGYGFIDKIYEETSELEYNYMHTIGKIDPLELSDIIIVCLNMAKHYNIDIQKALEEKTIFNENRKD